MSDYIVRYGVMRFLGVFSAPAGQSFRRGMKVIARTERGLEAGEVLDEAPAEAVGQLIDQPTGQILRVMSAEDENELARIQKHAAKELKMQLIEVERIFGGERIVIYYLADNRVDFRELVRLLAGEFQTRIEMRQIGVRDEAKLLADYGDCGCPVCCNTHLVQMPPVSMRMAKLQKATLDPTKISGRCGRLKCCLRYEYDTYEEIQKLLPPLGSMVITPEGRAKVVGQEILGRQLQVMTEDHRRLTLPLEQVEIDKDAAPLPEEPEAEEDEQVE
jgi:cell fate regulator YaaT (PSP1 superfamily)